MPDKTLAQKLFIKEGMTVLLVNAPSGYATKLGKLPSGASIVKQTATPVDFVQVFVANRKELEEQAAKVKKLLRPNGMLWICYLKGTSKTKTDINRDTLHAAAQKFGLLGVSLISIDDDWSAMRFKMK
jgi:hypothetical protein